MRDVSSATCVSCVGYFVGFDDQRVNETALVLFHGSCRVAGSQGSKGIKQRKCVKEGNPSRVMFSCLRGTLHVVWSGKYKNDGLGSLEDEEPFEQASSVLGSRGSGYDWGW